MSSALSTITLSLFNSTLSTLNHILSTLGEPPGRDKIKKGTDLNSPGAEATPTNYIEIQVAETYALSSSRWPLSVYFSQGLRLSAERILYGLTGNLLAPPKIDATTGELILEIYALNSSLPLTGGLFSLQDVPRVIAKVPKLTDYTDEEKTGNQTVYTAVQSVWTFVNDHLMNTTSNPVSYPKTISVIGMGFFDRPRINLNLEFDSPILPSPLSLPVESRSWNQFQLEPLVWISFPQPPTQP